MGPLITVDVYISMSTSTLCVCVGGEKKNSFVLYLMTPTSVPQKSEGVEPVTRSLRSAAKTACGKIKVRRGTRLFAF